MKHLDTPKGEEAAELWRGRVDFFPINCVISERGVIKCRQSQHMRIDSAFCIPAVLIILKSIFIL